MKSILHILRGMVFENALSDPPVDYMLKKFAMQLHHIEMVDTTKSITSINLSLNPLWSGFA